MCVWRPRRASAILQFAVNKSVDAEGQFGNSAHAFPLTPSLTPYPISPPSNPGCHAVPVTPLWLKEGSRGGRTDGRNEPSEEPKRRPSRLQNHFFSLLPSPKSNELEEQARRDHDVPLRADFTALPRSLAPNTKLARNRQGKEGGKAGRPAGSDGGRRRRGSMDGSPTEERPIRPTKPTNGAKNAGASEGNFRASGVLYLRRGVMALRRWQ